MNAFEEPFWNLDQLRAWMISRAPEAVQFARIGNDPRDTKKSWQIRMFAELAVRRMAKESQNIMEELWAASGLDKSSYQTTRRLRPSSPEERAVRKLCEKLPLETEFLMEEALTPKGRSSLIITGALDQVEPEMLRSLLKQLFAANPVRGPPQEIVVSQFPYLDYLLWLFRKGRLIAVGNLPDEPLAREISPADWAGLEIAVRADIHQLGVWRIGALKKNDGNGISRHRDAGDIEIVRVRRDEILKEFPERTPRAQNLQEVKPLSDDAARELIWDAASKKDGFITQNEGARILRTHDRSMKRDHARNIVRSMTGNGKRGPRGPRNKSAE